MATATFVQEGGAVDYTPSADVAAGDVVVQGDLVGVTPRPIAANTLGALAVGGVFEFPKATGTGKAIAAGKKVYWDATNKQATETSSGNTFLGKTVAAVGDSDATVRVRLSQ
jgi:predicted RecA/RadA family phage recombinase